MINLLRKIRQFVVRLGVWPSLLLGLGMLMIGLLTLNYIMNNWWPFDVARIDLVRATALDQVEAAALLEAAQTEILLAFLSAVLLTVTGLVLPLVFYLNKRFGPEQPLFLLVLRQSVWIGLWVAFCIWLQMNRTLGFAVATLVAVVLIMFETLLQIRTRAYQMATNS